jgi:fucose permease
MSNETSTASKINFPIVGLVFLTFCVISLITNVIGAILPDIGKAYSLSIGMSKFMQFAFFLAYVTSIPAGLLVERYREKPVMAGAFLMACVGTGAFAVMPTFVVGLAALFLVGIGMAMLQVAINPLLRVAGGDRHFSFFSVMAQALFGFSASGAPLLYSYLVGALQGPVEQRGPLVSALAGVVPKELPWISLYWVFAIIAAVMVLIVLLARLPRVELKDDERAGARAIYVELLRERQVKLYALGIFCYVGLEQGISGSISQFLEARHGLNPQTIGAAAVGGFWFWMTIGCLLGLLLLKLFDQRKVLIGASLLAMAALLAALFGSSNVALFAFSASGFCLSVMWSIIFSLALNSVPRHHGSFAGILCTAIAGGAFAPLLVGVLADVLGLRAGMLFLLLPLGYILSIGFWARPLVNNATIFTARNETAAAG